MKNNEKKIALDKIENLLTNLEQTSPKKCKNLSIWLKEYVNYLEFEDKFKPQKLCRYRKGQILKVNLGFNVGSEEGGVHYCMVLDKESSKNSPVITVIPLTSIKKNKDLSKLKKGEVNLGNELFRLLNVKVDKIKKDLGNDILNSQQKLEELRNKYENFKKTKKQLINMNENSDTYNLQEMEKLVKNSLYEIENEIKSINKNLDKMDNDKNLIEKIEKEISKMKKGSIALVNQITTVSKLRIIEPKKDRDVLSGIKLSNEKLDLIDEKIQEMYIKEKKY